MVSLRGSTSPSFTVSNNKKRKFQKTVFLRCHHPFIASIDHCLPTFTYLLTCLAVASEGESVFLVFIHFWIIAHGQSIIVPLHNHPTFPVNCVWVPTKTHNFVPTTNIRRSRIPAHTHTHTHQLFWRSDRTCSAVTSSSSSSSSRSVVPTCQPFQCLKTCDDP